MICYRDRTYCKFWDKCEDGWDCPSALTPETQGAADAFKLPICQYADYPRCFIPKTETIHINPPNLPPEVEPAE